MVSRSQTVEDGGPRQRIDTWLLHEGTPEEKIRIEIVIRRPYSLLNFTQRLVIRAEKASERITMALEGIRTE
jgi:hypothetical protein